MRRIVAGLAGLLATVLALTLVVAWARDRGPDELPGDPSGNPTATASTDPTQEPGVNDPPVPALAAFYDQELLWESCRDDFECAKLRVPLNYDNPAGRSINLALLKVASNGERIGSLVVNPGGPGAPGTDYAAYGDAVFTDRVMDAYDIVGFDPRGTGSSAPVDCLADPAMDALVSLDPEPDNKAEERAYLTTLQKFAAGCRADDAELVRQVGTVNAARDMDVLRAALGEATLDYLGASYGTKLGATYAELFPSRVGRLVLDGAIDPELDNRALVLGQAAGFENQLRAYVANCLEASDGDCFLGGSVDEGVARINRMLAEIDRTPLDTTSGKVLTSGDALLGLITPLYSEDNWFALSTGLKQAFNGDGTTLRLFADLYASRTAEGGFENNTLEANYAINCADDSFALKPAGVRRQLAAFGEASPTFGRALAWSLTSCAGFEKSDPKLPIDADGAPPILVVGTTGDPATPYAWAEALAEQLASGVLLTREGDGHTAYNMGNKCIDKAIEGFLIDGVVPVDGTTC